MRALLLALTLLALLVAACSGDDATVDPATPATDTPTTEPTLETESAEPPTPVLATTEPPPTDTPIPSTEPTGFPLDPPTILGVVTGPTGARVLVFGEGPTALDYSRDDQPSDDPDRANRSGWNCRVHFEYEGRPAVDWYIPTGTPITATMSGTATLYVITVSNAFDFYGADREPYIGDPDRADAPLSPFPGPGGGKGVFVTVADGTFVTEYAHLELGLTLTLVPEAAYLDGYAAGAGYAALFADMRAFNDVTAIAQWQVSAGDLIGYSGDAGYSEAPHPHYTVARTGGPLLCPTTESQFTDGGWLFR